MILNYIWLFFFGAAFIVAFLRLFGYLFRDYLAIHLGWLFDKADLSVFADMVHSTFDMAEASIKISIYLIGVMTLWLGIMKVGEKGGAIQVLGRVSGPFFSKLFPSIPKNHPAFGSILMNFCANMLGLDNAATPLGLKAMKDLQELNPDKETASNAQIMFLVLNTTGLTIIPVGIMGLRAAAGAASPSDIFLPTLIATFCATLTGLITVSIIQRINLLHPVVLAYICGLSLFIATLIWSMTGISPAKTDAISKLIGNLVIFLFIIFFLYLGFRKKVNVYDTFITGAKEGFEVAIRIIPYLVAMLVGIGVFRASGSLDFLVKGISRLVSWMGLNTNFVGALPTAFMKPLSGSGARGMMVETMKHYGADSFVGRLSCVFGGSTETLFYTLAVYYGSVGIVRTRYTVASGLIAEAGGFMAAILVSYLFFG